MEETFNPNALAMMPNAKEFRARGKASLTGVWDKAALATLIIVVCAAIAAIPFVGVLVSVFLVMPLAFGYSIGFLRHVRGEDPNGLTTRQFDAFKEYGRYLGTSLLMIVFIILWSLLLVIPGIIKAYAYAMTPYIMHDHPELDADDCISKSQEMMKGYKWKLFCLHFSFIGWILLCFLTLGILALWISPWTECSQVKFYEELKAREAAKQTPEA